MFLLFNTMGMRVVSKRTLSLRLEYLQFNKLSLQAVYGSNTVSFLDSTTSSNSDTEISCLHAGVCLSQTSVDATDSSIAVKAFEIMVMCLCARPELLGNPNIKAFTVFVNRNYNIDR